MWGYTAKEVKVGNRKVLAIDLSEDAQALEEVVVTAYGTGQKKASMVGSVQAIRPAELKVPSTNLPIHLPDVYPVWLLFSVQVVPVQTGRISGFEESQP